MKKQIKRILVLAIVILLSVSAFALTACQESTGIHIAAPNGAPAITLSKLMYEVDKIDGYKLSYSIKDGVNITASVLSGEADIALMPMNLASKLYNEGSDIKLVSVNIYGLLYLVGSGEYSDLESLKGKEVYIVGEGGTPDFTFKKILNAKGIDYSDKSDDPIPDKIVIKNATPDVLLPQVITGKVKYALLGEPQASIAIKNAKENINNEKLADLQELWQEVTGASISGYPQVGIVVKSDLLEKNESFVKKFLEEVELNIEWAKNNPNFAKKTIEDHNGIIPLLTKEIVDACNLRFVKASDAKADIETYLQALPGVAYGNKLPDENFYYSFK